MTEAFVISRGSDLRLDGLVASLVDRNYWIGNALEFVETNKSEWGSFCATWDDLKTDQFLADGSNYRQRRFSKLILDGTSGATAVVPHEAFFQSTAINQLHGGVQRLFEPCSEQLLNGTAFLSLLGFFAEAVDYGRSASRWDVHVHQHRVLAQNGRVGRPTPEGVHRDGVDFVFMMMVGRSGVDGGRSSLYDAAGSRVDAHELTQEGDCIIVDDTRLLHDVSPISRTLGATEGRRDMFFLEFTRRNDR